METDSPLVGRLDDGTPYISPSQVRELLRCGARWRYKYQDGLDDPIGVGAVVGFSVDDALSKACRAIIDGEPAPEADAVGDWARDAAYDKLEKGSIQWDPETDDADDLAAEAHRMADHGWKDFMDRDLVPLEVQGRVVKRMGAWAIMGYYDLRAETPDGYQVVVDWKVVGRSPSTDVDGTPLADRYYQYQVLAYVAALAEEGYPVAGAYVDHLVKTKTPRAVWAPVPVSEETIAWALNLYAQAVRVVQSDLLHPNPIGAGWMCHPGRCAFWDHCPGAARHELLTIEGGGEDS